MRIWLPGVWLRRTWSSGVWPLLVPTVPPVEEETTTPARTAFRTDRITVNPLATPGRRARARRAITGGRTTRVTIGPNC